jgi:HK97 family phage portal protein
MASRIEDRYDSMSMTELVGNIGKAVTAGFKAAATTMKFPGRRHWSEFFLNPRQSIDYVKEVGDGRGNAILMASVLWAAKNFPEAPLAIEQIKKGGKGNTPIPDHPLIALVNKPNPYYSGELLLYATITDWMFGNAYWRKIRNRLGEVIELWWMPSQLVEPKWGGTSSYLDFYEYRYDSGEDPERILPSDIVHFRNGLDPNNTRKGLGPLGSLMRELYTDNEAASYTATLLANLGVPGMIISPGANNVKIEPADVDAIKAAAETRWTGGNRGRAMVLSTPADVKMLSFNPDQMKTRDLRQVVEERVTSVIGIPAIVLGLGAGLQRSTFSNMAEAREVAYENFMIPSQRVIASEIRTQLLPDFVGVDTSSYRVFYDLAQVRVLQTDENEIHNRAGLDFKNMLASLNEARDMIGLPQLPKEQGDLFAVPMSVTLTKPDELWTEPEEVPEALAGAPPPSSTGPNSPEKPPPGEEGDSGAAERNPTPLRAAQLANGHSKHEDVGGYAIDIPHTGGYDFLV